MGEAEQAVQEPSVVNNGKAIPIENGIYPNLTLDDGTYLIVNYSTENCLSVDSEGFLTQVMKSKDKSMLLEKKGKLLRHVTGGKYLDVYGNSLSNLSPLGVCEKNGEATKIGCIALGPWGG